MLGLYHHLRNAAETFGEEVTRASVPWLVSGALISLLAQAVRTRGWHTILRATFPAATQLRARDTCAASLAGSGLNAVIPARGGDLVKLALVRRRIPDAPWSTLVGTFVPETVFETLFGTGLVVWALARGFLPVPHATGEVDALDVSFVLAHPFISAAIAGVAAVAVVLLVRWVRRTGADLLRRLADGVRILGSPRLFVTGVASWQALSRAIRLGSLACFMAAFRLPVTVSTAVLVMAAQGGGRIIPLAPVSTGLRLVMLFYGFAEVTGRAIDPGAITAFTVGMGAVLLVEQLVVSLTILAVVADARTPRGALRAVRRTLGQARSTGVPTGTRG